MLPEPTIRALAATFTPSLAGDDAVLGRVYSNVCYFFGDLPSDSRRKLSLLVRVVQGWSYLRYGRAVPDLTARQRHRLCEGLANAPLGRLQAGFTGLRSLLLIATYSEPALWDRIDYDGPTINSDFVKPSETNAV